MLKSIKLAACIAAVLFSVQTVAFAQSGSVADILKQHFNETVQQVKSTDDAVEKRAILNDSFSTMLSAAERIESEANLSDEERSQLLVLQNNIEQKKNELNGLDGFDEIADEDLDDFSDYSQQDMEQANRNITISLTTALLIVIILLLL
jgi:ABC-type antimicrobial peptide transport system permease subunit